jgi:hypothetical protein
LPLRIQVTVDLFPMAEIKRDGAVDLLERQNWKGLRYASGRPAREEPVHDRVERHLERAPTTRGLSKLSLAAVFASTIGWQLSAASQTLQNPQRVLIVTIVKQAWHLGAGELN